MAAPTDRKSLAAGVLELLRPPNVFTAVADSFAGLVLVRGGAVAAADPGLWLLAASACLYLGGLALNDYFDREIDARERPGRPIPSGAVPPALAAALGGGLLLAGVGAAALAGSPTLAALLAIAILGYDGLLKGTPAGFVNMGLCRGLNFLMPLALSPGPAALLVPPLLLAAYVSTLTYLARDEVGGNTRARVRRGLVGMTAVGAAVVATVASWHAPPVAWVLLALLLARGWSLFAPLRRDPGGPATGRAIGGGILAIPLFDATFVAAAGHAMWALAVAALVLPALWLRRLYSPT